MNQFSLDKPCVVTLSEISCSGFVMHTAFSKQSSQDLSGDASREDANRAPGGGLYVTHLLRRHGKLVWDTVLSREVLMNVLVLFSCCALLVEQVLHCSYSVTELLLLLL